MALAKILTVSYQEKIFHINVLYKDINNIYLKFSKKGQISLSAPKFSNQDFLLSFVEKHIAKFATAFNNYQNYSRISLDNKYLYIRENKHDIKLIASKKTKSPEIINNNIYFFVTSFSDDYVIKVVKNFYTKIAQEIFLIRTKEIASMMNQNPAKVSIKWLDAKWGYCQHRSKEITLSSQLMAYPSKVLDYVIIHELSHIIYPNHSTNFWNHVNRYCPDYKDMLGILKSEKH